MAGSEPLCVYCRQQPVQPAWRPFCSERCKLADLGRWLSEDYRVPDEPAEFPTDEGGSRDEDDNEKARRNPWPTR